MSDFDKEAEREKLREKYENDRASREVAEKMSELLLQGATMTNAHCSECGDPIFRYDGQEFCATCERPVDRDTGGEQQDQNPEQDDGTDEETDGDPPADTDDPETIEVTSPSDEARVQFGADGADTQASERGTRPQEQDDTEQRTERAASRTGGSGGDSPPREETRQPRTARAPAPDTAGTGPAGDVSTARESLVRTLTRFSELADATEDPQRAREHLAAAREAAEALSALRR